MGEGKTQVFQDQWFQYGSGVNKGKDQWGMIMKKGHQADNSEESSESSIGECSTISNGSSVTSEDMADDASSSPSCSSSSNSSTGALYDLSDLMVQLPIKRGLSNHYQGKSESFTSLARAMSIEDLAKKENPYKRKMMSCKSYAAGLDSYRPYTLPKPTISKKNSRSAAAFSSSFPSRKGSSINGSKPPTIPAQRNI